MLMSTEPQSSERQGGTGSFAAILRHPLHPMVVPITIGMYVAATCADLALIDTGDEFWARGTSWLLLGTVLSGGIAAIPGGFDLMLIERAQKLHSAWFHAGGNLLFLALVAVNYSWRQGGHQPGTSGLVLTLVGFVVLLITGWLGGEMSYRRGIGVAREID